MINPKLQIFLITGILCFAGLLLYFLIKKRLHLKYCLTWIAAVIVMLFSALFPKAVKAMAELMGIQTPSNFIFVIYGLFNLVIIFTLTAIVSHMNMRIFRLVQHQALIEERLRSIERLTEVQTEAFGKIQAERSTEEAVPSPSETGRIIQENPISV